MFARTIGGYPFLAPYLRPEPTSVAADVAARTLTLSTRELLSGAPWSAMNMLAHPLGRS